MLLLLQEDARLAQTHGLMAQSEQAVWNDFADLYDYIANGRNNTIDKLKRIIDGINDECHSIRPIPKHGKKQDLIDRICNEMNDWHAKRSTENYAHVKEVIVQVRDTGRYEPKRGPPAAIPGLVYSQALAPGPSNYALKGLQAAPALNGGAYQYNGLPRPSGHASSSSSSSVSKPVMRFTPSPFFRADQAVSTVVECMESISSMDRRSQVLSFTLSSEHVQKLALKPPRYQLRLFCTSSVYYSPSRTNQPPCPIEFPPTCEVRVNGTMINANLKGLKKKAGTAPPADLGSTVRVGVGSQNKVEIVYVNGQQPVQHKKFYLLVQLVETFSVESVIERVKKGKYKSKDEIMANMVQAVNDDDDIIAGPQKMSLKCPLSYVRISIPSRSIKCVHPQCFDASSWFSMMEQTTTWLCPVCEKTLNVEDLIVDGYFDSILQATDEDVEDVMVEADGEWHTTDNKYSSPGWQMKHGNAPVIPSPPKAAKAATPPPAPPLLASRQSVEEIVILDSDDDDDGRAAPPQSRFTAYRQAESSRASSSVGVRSSAAPRPSAGSSVIDLTIDSEDELPSYEPSPPPVRMGKRKERSPSENVGDMGKRARYELPPLMAPVNGSPTHINASPPMPYAHMNGLNGTVPTRTNGVGSAAGGPSSAGAARYGRLPVSPIPGSAQPYDLNNSYPMFAAFPPHAGLPVPPPPPPPVPAFNLPLPPTQQSRRASSGSGGSRQGW